VWIDRLRQNDPQAAAELWQRFFPRLTAVARRRLGSRPRRATDEEDAALSAFADFDRAVKAGRFPDLRDRNGLWALLLTFTVRKVQKHVDRERCRGGDRLRGADALCGDDGREPVAETGAPDEEATFQDSLDWLLSALSGEEPRLIALRKLEGHTNEEIAALLGCSCATIERRLRLIRETWQWLLAEEEKKLSE
jgi:DNA-directed RNA polymerase specialized sigma24 family protein